MRAVAWVVLLAPSLAWAVPVEVPPPAPAPGPDVEAPPAAPPEATPPGPAAVAAEPPLTLDELADEVAELEAKQRALEAAQRREASTREQVKSLLPLRRFITVFLDVGVFSVAGNGSGIRSDLGHVVYPRYAGEVAGQWVFLGDPMSTAINSLGEPADTSTSRELPTDTIDSEGRTSLIVNSLGLSIGKDVGHGIAIAALAELMPRPGPDLVTVELAHIDYRPDPELDLVLSAGKVDSVLGVEYRAQDAPRRIGVTPSLICRYTCGRPLGVQGRLVRGRLSASASLTNGDNFDERFAPDAVLKANRLPTLAGHLQWMLPVGPGLELGVSGAVGPQDGQAADDRAQWHLGFDARLRDLDGVDVTAEYVQGNQPGVTMSASACDAAACLRYKGAYVMVDRRMNRWFTPYVRVDWRDAVHRHGVDFVYESHTLRATVGSHLEVTSRILAKIEYTMNRELGPIPEFPNDVVTSSLVVATD